MVFLGTFAENDSPAPPSFGVFHRPTLGWYAALWMDYTGPFSERAAAEQHLTRSNYDSAVTRTACIAKVGVILFGSIVVLLFVLIGATVAIQLERVF